MRPEDDLLTARVRGLQGIYPKAHRALLNWGAWARDLRRVFPGDVAPSPTWREFVDDGKGNGYADEVEAPGDGQVEVKAESAERESYEELPALILDERIHAPGGLPLEVRRAVKVAYHSRLHDSQYARFAGCSEDAFCERLENALIFVECFG